MKNTLISIVGPTAIGKTALAIAIAKYYKTEIISADSRQFYKEMHIGTAIPTQEEINTVPHHFIQHKSIFDSYSVGNFEKEALMCLDQLFKKNNTVIMVGGSGLYVDAITKGLDEFPAIDPNIRLVLNKIYTKKGVEPLQLKLKELDKLTYSKIDINNPHRLIRVLEICIGTKKTYSSFIDKNEKKRPFKIITIGITADRALIYDRINQRVDLMIKKGLLEEVYNLIEYRNLNALQTVGYSELFNFFDNRCTLDFAISEIKKNTRRFAKRQLTWFKKNKNTLWVEYDEDFKVTIQKLLQKT